MRGRTPASELRALSFPTNHQQLRLILNADSGADAQWPGVCCPGARHTGLNPKANFINKQSSSCLLLPVSICLECFQHQATLECTF